MEKAINLIPGMTIEVGIVMDIGEGGRGMGAFISPSTTKTHDGKTYNLVNGFAVEDDTVGSIEPISGKPAVKYTHHKPEKNKIYFWSFEEWLVALSIVGVSIHDHSSIIQGGPAFGTYFTDDEVVE